MSYLSHKQVIVVLLQLQRQRVFTAVIVGQALITGGFGQSKNDITRVTDLGLDLLGMQAHNGIVEIERLRVVLVAI